jgi:type III secretion protein C
MTLFPADVLIGLQRPLLRLTVAAMALWAGVAQAMPIPFGQREVELTAREQPIAGFVQDLFGRIDIPVQISPSIKGNVNGNFSGSAERTWRNIARAFNLVEYYDGAVLHVYSPADLNTRTLPLSPNTATRVARAVDELKLNDARNTIRTTREGALIVSGVKRFIEQVEEIARAQALTDRAGAPTGFRVFYLRYAWAQDVTMTFGGRQVMLPGVASIVRGLMTSNPRTQVATSNYETPSSNTVPGMRSRGRNLGVLGNAEADLQQPSAPTLAAALANAPGGVSTGNGVQAAASQPIGADPGNLVRVEADPRLNAVIVRDVPSRMAVYEQLINSLDVEPQLLEIEATIIDINTDRMRELGVNWRWTRDRGSVLFGNGTDSDLRLNPLLAPGDITPSGNGFSFSGILGGRNDFVARINALQQQGAAKVVSNPQVVTLSNVEAVFDTSNTFYVRVAGRDEVDLFNVSAGTTLRVTPHVFKDNNEVRIKLLVNIEDGSLTERNVDSLPVVSRSALSTQALIYEGESLLVGGLVRESSGDQVTKVPLLGDIPLLGALFRSTKKSDGRIERMFLIQPRLSSGRGRQAAASVPSAPNTGALPAASGPGGRFSGNAVVTPVAPTTTVSPVSPAAPAAPSTASAPAAPQRNEGSNRFIGDNPEQIGGP